MPRGVPHAGRKGSTTVVVKKEEGEEAKAPKPVETEADRRNQRLAELENARQGEHVGENTVRPEIFNPEARGGYSGQPPADRIGENTIRPEIFPAPTRPAVVQPPPDQKEQRKLKKDDRAVPVLLKNGYVPLDATADAGGNFEKSEPGDTIYVTPKEARMLVNSGKAELVADFGEE